MSIQSIGRRALETKMVFLRELDAGDLALLLNPPPMESVHPPLTKIRATHHLLARLMADGRSDAVCAQITGYTPSWVSSIKLDPAFSELLSHYRAEVQEQYLDVHAQLASLGMTAIGELQERLHDKPEAFSNREVREVAEMALDRSVAPPKGAKASPGMAASASGMQININFVEPTQAPTTIDLGPAR